MSFGLIFLICAVIGAAAGAYCARLATRLTMTRGNTLAEIAKSSQLQAEAIKVSILDKVSIASNYPIVGLYIASLLFALSLPLGFLFIVLTHDHDPIRVSIKLLPSPTSGVVATPNRTQSDNPVITVPVFRSYATQTFALATQGQHLLTLDATYDWLDDSVTLSNVEVADANKSSKHVVRPRENDAYVEIDTRPAALPVSNEIPPNQPSR